MAANSDAHPHAPILFFDGGCALCHGAVRRLMRWERSGHRSLQFAPLKGTTAGALRSSGALHEDREAVALWTPAAVLTGEAATGMALELIGRQGWARAFRVLPAPLRRWAYRTTARNRHQWFGRVPNGCPVPTAPERFLP